MNRLINRVNNKNITEILLNSSNYSKIYYTTTASKKYKESELKAMITSFKGVEGDLPYLILSGAFNSLNKPKLVGKLTNLYLAQITKEDKKIEFVMRMREALLRAALVGGFPRALNSFAEVNKVLPEELKNKLPKEHLRDISPPIESLNAIGKQTFERIYTKTTDKLISNINGFCPDFLQFVIFNYGHVMGFESYIKLWENELILVGCLHPLNVPAQLKSHLIGAKKVGVEENVINSVELALSKLE